MKNISVMVLILVLLYNQSYSQVGIGTTNPDTTSILELKSTTKGFLPPRLTTVQRDMLVNLQPGLVIFNTDVNCLEIWDGTLWKSTCYTTPCDPANPGILIDVADVCYNGNPTVINEDQPASFGIASTILYIWQSSDDEGSNWTDIGGATISTYDPPTGLLVKRAYRRIAYTGSNCGPAATDTINVQVLNPAISAPNGPAAVCRGTTGAYYSIPGNSFAVNYSWAYSGTGVTFSTSETGPWNSGPYVTTLPEVYLKFDGTAGLGAYNLAVTADYTGSGCSNQVSPNLSITVNTSSITYDAFRVDGPACIKVGQGTGINQPYTITCNQTSIIYTWSLSGGGTITGATTGLNTTVNWNTTPGTYQVTVTPGLTGCTSGTSTDYPVTITTGTCYGSSGSVTCTDSDIVIGTQTWMRCNMNVGTMVTHANGTQDLSNAQGSASSPGTTRLVQKSCYGSSSTNCNTYGGLYSWAEALQYNCGISATGNTTKICNSTTCNTTLQRGICPYGYHIPTQSEWTVLINYLKVNGQGGSGTAPGTKTKNANPTSIAGLPAWNGTNTTKLSLLGGGYWEAGFTKMQTSATTGEARYWMSTERDADQGWYIAVKASTTTLDLKNDKKKYYGESVRCIKN